MTLTRSKDKTCHYCQEPAIIGINTTWVCQTHLEPQLKILRTTIDSVRAAVLAANQPVKVEPEKRRSRK